MRTEDVFHGSDVLPTAQAWRASFGLLCLLALLPLWGGLLLPLMPEPAAGAAAHGKRVMRDPFAIVLHDGHRLVCEGCRGLIGQLRQWAGPGASTLEAVKPVPALLRAAVPSRKQPADAAPIAPTPSRPVVIAVRRRPAHYSGVASFSDDVARVLPHYRGDFEEAARRNGLDWRLLAAVGYQESRWNPAAESPTGVRGLMMLTTDTALDLGVDRDDGAQSIRGAGRLLQNLYAQLPPRIREPDRTAMALAAYNQGIGHLLDARDVAVNRGGDPDRWSDVREALPLLSDVEWQKTTKYGFARGSEAVAFVDSVRQYHARLMSLSPALAAAKGAVPPAPSAPASTGKT